MDNAGLIALGMLRNRATPVKHKFITFVLERDASALDYTLGAARLAMLAAGAAAQALEISALVAGGEHSDTLEDQAAAFGNPADWVVTYKVTSKWFAEGNVTDDASGQRSVLQAEGANGQPKLTVSKVARAALGDWTPSGSLVAEQVDSYEKKSSDPGSNVHVEEEAYDLSTLSDWTSWGAVPKPERLAIEAQIGGATDFHDARTSVRYSGGSVEARTHTSTLEGTALTTAIKPLLLRIPGLLDDLDGSKRVDQLPKVGEVSAKDRQSALRSLILTGPGGATTSPGASTHLAYVGSVLADLDSSATGAGSFPLPASGRVETTYEITTALGAGTYTKVDLPALTEELSGEGWGWGLNTEFMRWFAEFQEIDYQGNLANAEGFYELGTNGPRPRFVTADWNGVTLKTGFVNQGWLFRWTQLVDWGQDFRKDLAIIMFDRAGAPLRLIRVMNAFPVSWKGPVLSAGDSGSQPIESIELTCESLEVTVLRL